MTIHNDPNPTREQVEEELATEFDQLKSSEKKGFLYECVEIGHFLSNRARVEQGLKELDAALQQKVDVRLPQFIEHYKARSINPRLAESKLDADLKHLLSQELTGMEIRWGFSGFVAPKGQGYAQGQKVQTYTRFVDPEAFVEQVRLGRHWKDPTVPGQHGEYAHRLQWYLAGMQLKDVIKRPLVDVFREVGTVPRGRDFTYGLWYALFDRDSGLDEKAPFRITKGVALDARSPESLTAFIVDDAGEARFPIVHWFIKARLKKRDSQPLNNYGDMLMYVERKIKKFGLNIGTRDVIGKVTARSKGAQVGGSGRLESGTEVVGRR